MQTNSPQLESAQLSDDSARDATLISRVNNATDTATKDCSAIEIIDQIRSGQRGLRERILRIRNEYWRVMAATNNDRNVAKKAVDKFKKALPAVTWSGTFSRRSKNALTCHSGLLCCDIDNVGRENLADICSKLRVSIHLFALFISPTGDGIKAIFVVVADAAQHEASFRAVEKIVRELTGLQVDKACSDVARLCFFSYDPDVYLNENAVELPPLPEENPARKIQEPVSDEKLQKRRETVEELLGDIDWETDIRGFCGCPGQHLHTTGDGDRDCIVYLDTVPTVKCFHDHCRGIISGINKELRSRIGKAEWGRGVSPGQWFNQKFPSVAEKFGDPILIGETGDGDLFVKDISEDFVAATLHEESRPDTPTIFVPIEQKFYTYSTDNGIFRHVREPNLVAALSRLLLDCAEDCKRGLIDIRPLKFRLRDSKKLAGVLTKAQGILAAPDDFFATGLTEFIPCANGMLRLSDRKLLPFSPNYRRRNKLSVAFDPDAKCRLFSEILMQPALDFEDLDLLGRWSGLTLIGENLAQRFPILTGTAGGGKGTFVRVITGILGQTNIASLRTHLLGERFEVGRFLGKTLLYGADVPEKFLNHRAASVLKSLTGGDPVALEFKRSNESPVITCKFNAIVTCNSRLTVRLEGDTEAWRRRLMIIEYHKEKAKNVIADLSERILAEESSGVLNWMLDGLEKLRADGWQLYLTPAQQKRVDDLLLQSESHVIFAEEALLLEDGKLLTVEDCYTAYVRFCTERGWVILPRNKFSNLIGDAVARMYGLTIRHDITLGQFQTQQRGWKGLTIGSVLQGDLE